MAEEWTHVATGKVADVPTSNNLAIAAGRDKGVEKDDVVVLNRVVIVKDPDTSEVLGEVNYPKVRLKVYLVDERFCVARVTDRTAGSPGKLGAVKTVTSEPMDVDSRTVLVEIGEVATIRRKVQTAVEDEPPF